MHCRSCVAFGTGANSTVSRVEAGEELARVLLSQTTPVFCRSELLPTSHRHGACTDSAAVPGGMTVTQRLRRCAWISDTAVPLPLATPRPGLSGHRTRPPHEGAELRPDPPTTSSPPWRRDRRRRRGRRRGRRHGRRCRLCRWRHQRTRNCARPKITHRRLVCRKVCTGRGSKAWRVRRGGSSSEFEEKGLWMRVAGTCLRLVNEKQTELRSDGSR